MHEPQPNYRTIASVITALLMAIAALILIGSLSGCSVGLTMTKFDKDNNASSKSLAWSWVSKLDAGLLRSEMSAKDVDDSTTSTWQMKNGVEGFSADGTKALDTAIEALGELRKAVAP